MAEEISAAEKRRLLREKRAAKMATGGSRLNKILGSNENEEVSSNNQPEPAQKINTTSSNARSTNNPQLRPISEKPKNKSNRISVMIDQENEDDDPPVSGLDDLEMSLESDSPLQEFVSNEKAEFELEQFLNKMLQNSAHDDKNAHGHGEPTNPQDFFGKEMASMFAGLNGKGGNDGMPPIPGMGNLPIKSEIELAKSKLYQSGFAVFRFILIWILISSYNPDSTISSYITFSFNTSLWTQFLYGEIVFGLVHLLLTSLSVFPNHTIMSFDVSSFGYANSALTAYSFARNFFNDFCCLIVIIGLSTFFSK
jgi:hypothetical protein